MIGANNSIVDGFTVTGGNADKENGGEIYDNKGGGILNYSAGYRPKPEYINQLAVVRNLSSGTENSIHFKMKVDLTFLAANPDTRRSLKMFVQCDVVIEYLFYPKSPADIL